MSLNNIEMRLVADVGGTNARFGLASMVDGRITIAAEQIYSCDAYPEFEQALHAYLNQLGEPPKKACIAVAGPVIRNSIRMTNLPWSFSGNDLAEKFGFTEVVLINDFCAQACALPVLSQCDFVSLKSGIEAPLETKAIIGPGTGLGVASLVNVNGNWHPISGEGGHVSLPVSNAREAELLQAVASQMQLDYVSAETLLCGSGLARLYQALSAINGKISPAKTPVQITQDYRRDPLAKSALQLFLQLLGGAARNLAVIVGAKGGVFLTGGILPRIQELLKEGEFVNSFANAGPMSHYLESIPVHLVVHQNPALLGAAAWLDSN